ncbi:MAG: two-component system, OmpR family, sensor kinase [Acidobacteriota bacterium]|jgi:signal transduction histidine kinase|nr:two-component system, OmpR family, sensor kinase [Acidobacteriota bacterium]
MNWHDRQPRWRGARFRHREDMPRFVRFLGCAVAAWMGLAAAGSGAIASLLMRKPQLTVPVAAIGGAALVIMVAALVTVTSGVARVFRRQDRLRRQLMADVAHELRTPLSILQGRIEGLLDGVYPRDDARLGELLDETRHLGRIVEDVRTLANAEAGALDLRKEAVDPAELIRDAAASFDVPIAVQIADGLPSIDADPVRIREVLLNLLSNAISHTPTGGTITVHAVPSGRGVTIRVVDTGSGIPADELPHIFERFRKDVQSRGSGLGLAIARNLVLAHGGEIHAESTVGKGTTVTVTLR